MSRKHFKALAQALRETNATRQTIARIADELAGMSATFNRAKFIEAASPA